MTFHCLGGLVVVIPKLVCDTRGELLNLIVLDQAYWKFFVFGQVFWGETITQKQGAWYP